jgi:rhodanese-related sulfurtransferase
MKRFVTCLVVGLAFSGSAVMAQSAGHNVNTVPTISRDEVKAEFDHHKAILVEALPPNFFKRSRLPGSLNIPMEGAEKVIPKLLPNKKAEIIVYCMNPK